MACIKYGHLKSSVAILAQASVPVCSLVLVVSDQTMELEPDGEHISDALQMQVVTASGLLIDGRGVRHERVGPTNAEEALSWAASAWMMLREKLVDGFDLCTD